MFGIHIKFWYKQCNIFAYIENLVATAYEKLMGTRLQVISSLFDNIYDAKHLLIPEISLCKNQFVEASFNVYFL